MRSMALAAKAGPSPMPGSSPVQTQRRLRAFSWERNYPSPTRASPTRLAARSPAASSALISTDPATSSIRPVAAAPRRSSLGPFPRKPASPEWGPSRGPPWLAFRSTVAPALSSITACCAAGNTACRKPTAVQSSTDPAQQSSVGATAASKETVQPVRASICPVPPALLTIAGPSPAAAAPAPAAMVSVAAMASIWRRER